MQRARHVLIGRKSMTYKEYFNNLLDAICGIKHTKIKEVIKYTKDPQGLIKRDIAIIRRYASSKPYKVGESLEQVAWNAGQEALITMIETKLIAPKTTQLN